MTIHVMRRRVLAVVAGVLLLLSLPALAVSLLWAAFFSVGTRGGSTSEMIRYNLSDPVAALIAYSPLALSILLLVGSIACGVAALLVRSHASTFAKT